MHWIASAGGPLVLVPQAMAAQWQGISNGGSDYAVACMIDDYASVIQWNGVDVLILNDEPLATTCLTDGLTVFVRWIYAPNEEAIKNVIQDITLLFLKRNQGVAFGCQADKYVLFDAGAPGTHIVERIEVNIAPGAYIVETHIWRPNEDVGLVVHVLRPHENLHI
jgi:Immunity protein 21